MDVTSYRTLLYVCQGKQPGNQQVDSLSALALPSSTTRPRLEASLCFLRRDDLAKTCPPVNI